MKTKKYESGQALIFIVAAIVGLVAMTGLTVDGGLTYVDRESAQSSADSAAFGAALAKVRGQNVTTKALSIAATNGYVNNITHDTITVTNPITSTTTGCDGQTIRSEYRTADYIHVKIVTNVKAYFAPIVGVKQTHNCVEAIARAVTGGAGAGMYGGAAIVATKPTGNQAMLLNGSAVVRTTGTGAGVFINSSGAQALFLNGSASLIMASPARVVGGYSVNGSPTITPSVLTGQTQLAMPDPTWDSIPPIPTKPTCSVNGTVASGSGYTINGSPPSFTANGTVTATINSGNWNSITVNGANSTLTLNPGTYCISGNLNLNGSGDMIRAPSGQVQLVLSQSITLNGGVGLTANDLEIYATNGSWTLNGGATMNATRLRFYSSGSSNLTVNGNATLTSSNAYILLTSGSPVWNGNSTITLAAPPIGDPYAGLLFYMPWSNTNSVILNGGSTVSMTGTMLMPHSAVTANGASSFTALNSQIIGYTFLFNGGGNFNVNYNPSQNYNPSVQASAIELIK